MTVRPFLLLVALFTSVDGAWSQVGTADRQDMADDAFQIIQMKRTAWSRQQRRDPEYFEELRRNLSKEYVYKAPGDQAGREQYLRDVVNSRLESFELSDFKVVFSSPTDAVMTHKAVFRISSQGRRMLKSCYFTTVLKKANGVWYEVSYTERAAK